MAWRWAGLLKLAGLTTPLRGIPDGHMGVRQREGPHRHARVGAVALGTATSICRVLRLGVALALGSHPLALPGVHTSLSHGGLPCPLPVALLLVQCPSCCR